MKLTTEALFLLAAEEAVFPSSQDALDRLAYLVGPIFQAMSKGSLITAQIAAETIGKNFGLSITNEVAGALLFRLGNLEFIESELVSGSRVFTANGSLSKESGSSVIDELVKDFRLFVDDKKLLPKITDDEILELFMAKLFQISDFLGEDSFTTSKTDKLDEWKLSLISDYVLQHTDELGNLPPLLTKLAELCLMRSVVGNLSSQNKAPKKSTLKVILDAPIALFAIGASGRQQQKNILSTFDLAKSFGVQMMVLPISLNEMNRVMYSVLNTDHRDRRGYTAAAIRRGDLIETVAEDMKSNPEKYIKNQGIAVSPRNMSSFPNEQNFFTNEEYEEFSATASTWAGTLPAQYHDAECLSVTMRARNGKHARHLFSNEYVFVTLNGRFVSAARRACLEKFKINESQFPPVVHMNDFAASVWLAGGFQSDNLIPERTLLAACERALNGVESVLSKTESLAKELMLADDATLELLLMDRDSVSAIAKSVSYDPSLINESNVGKLISLAKKAVAKEVAQEAKSERDELVKMHSKELRDIQNTSKNEAQNLERQLTSIRKEAEAHQIEIDRLIEQGREKEEKEKEMAVFRVNQINSKVSLRGRRLLGVLETVFLIIASILMGFKSSLTLGIAAMVVGGIFLVLGYLEVSYPHRINSWVLKKFSEKSVRREFSQFEIDALGIEIDNSALVTFKGGSLTPPPSPANS